MRRGTSSARDESARMMGAIFTKFGRAPTMQSILKGLDPFMLLIPIECTLVGDCSNAATRPAVRSTLDGKSWKISNARCLNIATVASH